MLFYRLSMMEELRKRKGKFDIIHNHAQYLAMFMADFISTPVVHTIHGSYYQSEIPDEKRKVLEVFKKHRFVSISNNQRGGFPDLNFIGTVYNGIDTNDYTYVEKPRGDYLLWVGRIVAKKGPLTAIEMAKKLNMPLVIAAAVDPVDRPYFEKEVKPHIDKKLVTFVGELTQGTLNHLYGNALCTLFPITWHEPFGLVMIESLVCGTPVVAYNIGSVPEVIEDGKTGFVVDVDSSVEGLSHAVSKINILQRGDCHSSVVERFSKEAMVKGYIEVYKKILPLK